jgi:hypothetical protein
MKKPGFFSAKAFLALSSSGTHDEKVDWDRIVTLWSSIITIGLIALYFLQRSS